MLTSHTCWRVERSDPVHPSARVQGRLCTALQSVRHGHHVKAGTGGGVVFPKTMLSREKELPSLGRLTSRVLVLPSEDTVRVSSVVI